MHYYGINVLTLIKISVQSIFVQHICTIFVQRSVTDGSCTRKPHLRTLFLAGHPSNKDMNFMQEQGLAKSSSHAHLFCYCYQYGVY